MVSASDVPSVEMNSGKKIPIVGLGTWKSQPGEVAAAVATAIDAGYRHIDGAFIYGNENEVGEGIRKKIADGTVKREDLFITTKVWNTYHSRAKVAECLQMSLKTLGLDYVDLALIHWPMGLKEGGENFPKVKEGEKQDMPSDVHYTETWKGMEDCLEKGMAKSIGVSNFNSEQLNEILKSGTVKPAINQVECHPWLPQTKLIAFCKEKGIVVQAYSPLGSPDRPWATPDDPKLMDDELLKKIADKHGKSVAQVCIKFQTQRGVVVLPKSVTPSRIQANIDVLDFALSDEDMTSLATLDQGEKGRVCHLRWNEKHPFFPFNIEF